MIQIKLNPDTQGLAMVLSRFEAGFYIAENADGLFWCHENYIVEPCFPSEKDAIDQLLEMGFLQKESHPGQNTNETL